MGPTWVLSAPDGSHVGPMKLANRHKENNVCVIPIPYHVLWGIGDTVAVHEIRPAHLPNADNDKWGQVKI